MVVQTTDELSALSAGCEVWMMTKPSSSAWARKIDWYLNFQTMKAGLHPNSSPSMELKRIAAETAEAELPQVEISDSAPLMVACENLLPATTVIIVNYTGDIKTWAEKCHEIWRKLKRPRLRVFLPDSEQLDVFITRWPKSSGADSALGHVEIVPGA